MTIKKVRFVEIESTDFIASIRLELIQAYTSTGDKVLIKLREQEIEVKLSDLKEALESL
jgi:hypothetical protein